MPEIYFVGTCTDEEEYLRDFLSDCSLHFLRDLSEVPVDAEILCVDIHHAINKEFVEKHRRLRMLATRSTSRDHIDYETCEAAGIHVFPVADYGENTVAEHVFALLLALTRKLRRCYDSVRTGKLRAEDLRGSDLFGKTMGVIGCGRVGLHVVRVATGFRMRVLGHDSHPHPFHTELLDFAYADLDTIFEQADILTLHVPINPTTRSLLNSETIARCKPGVIIINTARGGLIDLDAAADALESGHIGGIGLDVLEDERIFHGGASNILGRQIAERVRVEESDDNELSRVEEIRRLMRSHRLLQHPNVVFTPHTAFNSHEAIRRICECAAQSIKTFIEGSMPEEPVVLLPEPDTFP
jgi:D-lactate dehydrogenase